jgi:hypothetical protein
MFLVVLGLALLLPVTGFSADYLTGLSDATPMLVDKKAKEIRLLATLQPKAFETGWFKQLPGHHAVTWKDGRKGHEALLATLTSDTQVYDAMISIGAKPGNNLTQAVWDERKNNRSKAPETRVEGSSVAVFVWWKGLEEPLPLKNLLKDPSGKGIDMRFGGNKALIPVWKSGCIVCLQSCPGGKISNHNYTIRDYMEDKATFTVNRSVVPKGTRKAVVIIRLR